MIPKKAKQQFRQNRAKARRRGIGFTLTLEEWWKVWSDSGNWHKRGRKRGQYVLSRPGDKGPYALGNVRVVLCTVNHRNVSRAVRSTNSKGNKSFTGRKHSAETIEKMKASHRRRFQ
jgi:hypothetical protein